MRSLLFVNKKKQKNFGTRYTTDRGIAIAPVLIHVVVKFFWFFLFTKRTRISLPSPNYPDLIPAYSN